MDDDGRYRVTCRIAQGGMAEVFEGVALGPEGFQRRVAIKRLRAENAADPAFGRMFLDEAHIASQLHHANIVDVLDFGVADAFPFQVLELIDGVDAGRLQSLGAEAGASLPVALALSICTDIAHALELEHAHNAVGADGRAIGIGHRDVSPGNILVSWSGDVELSDFGIALARGRLETTSAGLTKGTLLEMAPEQVMRGEIDGRTDVFALGCVLHALVAGDSPPAGENALADLIADQPLRISPDLPDDIYDIVARATRLAKADRFPTAAAMAAALGTALARRLDRDARSLMRDWLARRRPASPPVTAGKLDALLVFDGLRKSLPPGALDVPALDELTIDEPARRRWSAPPTPAPAPAPAPPPAHPRPAAHHVAAPPPAPASDASGILAVGRDGARQDEILVDGSARGHAPRALSLPVGTHEVILVRPDGGRVARTVQIPAAHTPSAPLRWVVP